MPLSSAALFKIPRTGCFPAKQNRPFEGGFAGLRNDLFFQNGYTGQFFAFHPFEESTAGCRNI